MGLSEQGLGVYVPGHQAMVFSTSGPGKEIACPFPTGKLHSDQYLGCVFTGKPNELLT